MKKFITLMVVAVIATSFSTAFAQDNSRIYDKGVVINGVKWAMRNVDAVGTFANTPQSAGMFYQWNRKKAWAATGKEVTDWDSSILAGYTWEKANDPSPKGWRVPNIDEIEKLLDESKVSNKLTTQNGVNGIKFTDIATGKSLFLPAARYRLDYNGVLYYAGGCGGYWSSTKGYSDNAYYLFFFYNGYSGGVNTNYGDRSFGFSVRPVAE